VAAKLGIAARSTLVLLGAPDDGLLGPLPPDVCVGHRARGRPDVVVAFFTEVAPLERRITTLATMVFPDASLWIAWPKRSAGVPTTVNAEEVRRVALAIGLVDNKVCAIDDTWTGLRLVWRRERRVR
jgi:hypothetical protein